VRLAINPLSMPPWRLHIGNGARIAPNVIERGFLMSIPLQAGAVIDWSGSAAVRRAMSVAEVNAKVTQATTAPDGKALAHADGQNQRLVIEQDKPTGSFVYKTVDRLNGDVLFQYPSDELLRLRNNPAYVSGAVYSKSA